MNQGQLPVLQGDSLLWSHVHQLPQRGGAREMVIMNTGFLSWRVPLPTWDMRSRNARRAWGPEWKDQMEAQVFDKETREGSGRQLGTLERSYCGDCPEEGVGCGRDESRGREGVTQISALPVVVLFRACEDGATSLYAGRHGHVFSSPPTGLLLMLSRPCR